MKLGFKRTEHTNAEACVQEALNGRFSGATGSSAIPDTVLEVWLVAKTACIIGIGATEPGELGSNLSTAVCLRKKKRSAQ